ncbi:GNAT family N-acetyltransferase [Nocardiopsis composta]|uniref:Lysine N-acyltransferase MbtK n=1 Tax=Nocardiopsis composta TaxID=157465 RepID=A0A7W8QK07_9ACTN|nr:GNAT family N-acetyltransferase [Nocardiopsis composta]MBB5431659.1 RimJ/RimL family protein N-acetyltransferase [Nocardiopsis composta]
MPDSTRAPWRSPREIDAGPEALAAGPPPVPVRAAPFDVRVASAEGPDLELVHAWMNRPHVADFYDQAWPRERWAEELAGQASGTFSRPLIISEDGADIAYIELYRAARDVVGRTYPAEPHDVGLHIAIGRRVDTGRGTGTRIFESLTRAVFEADPLCARVLIEPDVANAAVRKAAQRAGLRFGGEVDLPHKRAALYYKERAAAAAAPEGGEAER